MDKIMLLGSGELGRELVISLKRLGRHVVAVDSYDNAPAMQVADEREVVNMLDGDELDRIVDKHRPVMIVPEIEAIRTERFYDYEQRGIQVIPSARAANFTMNRKAIRDLAAQDLGLRTAPYAYATDLASLQDAAGRIGFPSVVKPLMSSSGKGQSVLRSAEDVSKAWAYALEGSRGDVVEVIVEGFIDFHLEITLLTVTTVDGSVLFCPPIGHVQARGDYQESWQPAAMTEAQLKDAQDMAEKVTRSLGGPGLWGVEFFIATDGVYFSELSPRPHDTGMVTLSGSQDLSEFDLHARAITGLPIPGIALRRNGASAVILAEREGDAPVFSGLKDALAIPGSDIRLFGKPTTRPYRRMGVALYSSDTETVDEVREKAKAIAAFVTIN